MSEEINTLYERTKVVLNDILTLKNEIVELERNPSLEKLHFTLGHANQIFDILAIIRTDYDLFLEKMITSEQIILLNSNKRYYNSVIDRFGLYKKRLLILSSKLRGEL